MTKIFIDGHEGTTGLRIHERLSTRPELELLSIAQEDRKNPDAKRALYEQADVVFMCLPDAAAKESVPLVPERVTVIDASTAHRVAPGWAYGFPELSAKHREALTLSKRIANPGCHASGFLSLVYPMTACGLMPADYPVVCHSLTGYSGGGRRMIEQYNNETRDAELSSPRQYGLTQAHKHLPEMQRIAGLAQAPAFSPIVADYYAGMEVTVPLFNAMLRGNPDRKQVWEALAAHYEGSKMVRVMPYDEVPGFMGSNNMAGRDTMEIFVAGNDRCTLLISRFDNLGKGASGAAIQSMNIALGLDESTGLTL